MQKEHWATRYLSQKEVYEILKELGGKATTQEIRIKAKEKFPDFSLHTYVSNRLRKLEKNGYVKKVRINGQHVWEIVAEYP